jgi:hypothetical protein
MIRMIKLFCLMTCLLISTLGLANHFAVVNTAPYKLTIIARFADGHHHTWYCSRDQTCHFRHFPNGVRRTIISRYSNANKFGRYPNRTSHPRRPFHNKHIRCVNHRHSIECYRYIPH